MTGTSRTIAVAEKPVVDSQNPWPGLASYEEEFHAFFHGRNQEADELFRRVKWRVLTVLFGRSGLGKSSLLRAGLFPKLREEAFLPILIRLKFTDGAPELGAQVKSAIALAYQKAKFTEATRPKSDEALWEYFHGVDLQLVDDHRKPFLPVLVFDQFEELFTLGQAGPTDHSRMVRFFTELADLVENRSPAILEKRLEDDPDLVERFVFDRQDFRVLVSLREDYLPEMESLHPLIPSLVNSRMRLRRMTERQAVDAVIRPGGEIVSLDVARQIVRSLAGNQAHEVGWEGGEASTDALVGLEVEPCLLSLVCRELNNRRRRAGSVRITLESLADSSFSILQDFYGDCLEKQPWAVRVFVEEDLLTRAGFRDNVDLEKARQVLSERGASASAIEELVRCRLLHVEDHLGSQRIELIHDVLVPVVKLSRDERRRQEANRQGQEAKQEAARRVEQWGRQERQQWNEKNWEQLLGSIEAQTVIPIVGPELLSVQTGGKKILLDRYLATELAAEFQLPAVREPILNDVICQILDRHEQLGVISWTVSAILKKACLVPPEPLRRLAEIRHFNLFITTTIDPLLEEALNEVRFGGMRETKWVDYRHNKGEDRSNDLDAEKDELTTTVFYLMGKASSIPGYVLTDEDLLELVCNIQLEARRPKNLFHELEENDLLVLGQNFPDWLARIFLRTVKQRRLSFGRDRWEIVADKHTPRDSDLLYFLGHYSRSTRVYPHGGAVDFVEELCRRWHARNPDSLFNSAEPQIPPPAENAACCHLSQLLERRCHRCEKVKGRSRCCRPRRVVRQGATQRVRVIRNEDQAVHSRMLLFCAPPFKKHREPPCRILSKGVALGRGAGSRAVTPVHLSHRCG